MVVVGGGSSSSSRDEEPACDSVVRNFDEMMNCDVFDVDLNGDRRLGFGSPA